MVLASGRRVFRFVYRGLGMDFGWLAEWTTVEQEQVLDSRT